MAGTTIPLFVEQYLKRLQYSGPHLPNLATIQRLYYRHLLTIPFENLSNLKNEEYVTTKDELFQKIIQGQRGGLCFELNGLFGFLLQELGFKVITFGARVFSMVKNSFSPRECHLISVVNLNGEQWLIDVGFGDGFTVPFRLVADEVQDGGNSFYRLKKVKEEDGVEQFELEVQGRKSDLAVCLGSAKDKPVDLSEWTCLYSFTTKPRSLSFFDESKEYILRNRESTFNQGLICTVLRPWGRVTLSRRKLIKTYIDGKRVVRKDVEDLENEEDVWLTLEREFGVKYN